MQDKIFGKWEIYDHEKCIYANITLQVHVYHGKCVSVLTLQAHVYLSIKLLYVVTK